MAETSANKSIVGSDENIQQFLLNHRICELRDPKRHGRLISVGASTTVDDTIKLMRQQNLISIPVRDDTALHGRFLGIANLMDIVNATVFTSIFQTYNTNEAVESLSAAHAEIVFAGVRDLPIFHQPIRTLLGASTEFQLLFDANDTLQHLLQTFMLGIHRVLVRDPHEESTFFLASQTDMIRYFVSQYLHQDIKNILMSPIEHLGLAPKSVVTMPPTATALTGFRKMALENVRIVAIVNEKGVLVGNLSASDIRGLTRETFHHVLNNVTDFTRAAHTKYHERSEARPLITCYPHDHLSTVLAKMSEERVHHVWMVDKEMHPIGVVSMTDVLRAVGYYHSLAAKEMRRFD